MLDLLWLIPLLPFAGAAINGCVNGCGSCDVGGRSQPLWPVLGVTALAAVGILVRRDRRRRRASRPSESEQE